MPLVHECADPECTTLTMGAYCVAHEARPAAPQHPARRLATAAFAAAVAGFAAAFLARARIL